jgi:predicted PurR-regulated permease PerM
MPKLAQCIDDLSAQAAPKLVSAGFLTPFVLSCGTITIPFAFLFQSLQVRRQVTVTQSQTPEVNGRFDWPPIDLGGRARATDTTIIFVAVIAGLYFGRDMLVPIALAVLLSFVLAPVAAALARFRIGRVASVLLSVLLAFAILGGLGAIIGKQVAQLAENLPEYQVVIAQKLETLRNSDLGGGVMEKALDALHGLNASIGKPGHSSPIASAAVATRPLGQPQPFLPVEVHEPSPGPVQILQSVLSALLPPLATAAIVVVFVLFILLQRTDLRDRFIGLTGAHDLHRTTKALDDAAERLSRYFLALTGINAAFGVAIAVGLTFIGVPNPILWGIVGAVLRFVPYVGALIAAAFPLALAAAVDPGWSKVVETGLLFVALETAMGQVIEPKLFGHTTGMSPLAVVVAIAFWTLIWGPPGLLLSTPITACLVVLGRHVESLNFIELLLGDQPVLSPVQSFYQRILADDPDEVAFQAEALLQDVSLLDYYEHVALPALALAQADVIRGVMDVDRQAKVCSTVEHVVADLADHVEEPRESGDLTPESKLKVEEGSIPAIAGEKAQIQPSPNAVLCLAGRTPLDQAACAILVQILERRNIATRVAGPQALTTSGIFQLNPDGISAICIFYLNHQSVAAVRYAVRRVRRKFPNTPIGVCLWGSVNLSVMADAAQADATIGSLREAVYFCSGAAKPIHPPIDEGGSQIRLVAG